MRLLLCWVLLGGVAWADDVAVCDPTSQPVANAVTRFERSLDGQPLKGRTGFLVWQAPHTAMTDAEQIAMNLLRSQLDSLRGVPLRYWVCRDIDANGLLDAVGEMTQAQKDMVDAPAAAEAARRAALVLERDGLRSAMDAAVASWGSLTPVERMEAMRNTMRLNRVERALEEP